MFCSQRRVNICIPHHPHCAALTPKPRLKRSKVCGIKAKFFVFSPWENWDWGILPEDVSYPHSLPCTLSAPPPFFNHSPFRSILPHLSLILSCFVWTSLFSPSPPLIQLFSLLYASLGESARRSLSVFGASLPSPCQPPSIQRKRQRCHYGPAPRKTRQGKWKLQRGGREGEEGKDNMTRRRCTDDKCLHWGL